MSKLAESATREILLISPGQGSSGFYPPETLRASGAAAFPAGTQMFVNHPTESESFEQPEGDLNQLAAVLLDDARYEENGREGPGLYSRAFIFSKFQDDILEKAPFTGLSIFANGSFEIGEAGERIVTAIDPGPFNRVDFVTKAGRGGKLLAESAKGDPAIIESARLLSNPTQQEKAAIKNQTEVNMNELQEAQAALAEATQTIEQQQEQIIEANTSIKKLREMLIQSEARDFVTTQLEDSGLPAVVKVRITRECLRDIPTGDNGQIDSEKYANAINAAITEAQNEIAAITGNNAKITGMGGQQPNSNGMQVPSFEESQKAIKEALSGLGGY